MAAAVGRRGHRGPLLPRSGEPLMDLSSLDRAPTVTSNESGRTSSGFFPRRRRSWPHLLVPLGLVSRRPCPASPIPHARIRHSSSIWIKSTTSPLLVAVSGETLICATRRYSGATPPRAAWSRPPCSSVAPPPPPQRCTSLTSAVAATPALRLAAIRPPPRRPLDLTTEPPHESNRNR
ncbi:uncharacterized protein LOC119336936 [Triticum dicoccoides]|uniref:uncharacterized protein LOC119336936 n=1 Tax=Triticum dicoccoides TaxID=85692 RepID=UPI001891EB19|nr:uncharacterized protein LOC119336936 [Triticum dicoccoides]XP_044432982.1 uncharacterized protein LOC123159217 [Triticum aestivum]